MTYDSKGTPSAENGINPTTTTISAPKQQFSKFNPKVIPIDNSGDSCKCAYRYLDFIFSLGQHVLSFSIFCREAEKAQLRQLNDRHLLLLSEKQGVINCLMQKVENLTELR